MQKSFIIVSLAFIGVAFCVSIGDRVVRTAILYHALPLTESDAVNSGWTAISTCDPNLGTAYVATEDGPTKGDPVIVYFTGGGQIAGIGMEHYGNPLNGLQKFWLPDPESSGNYRISVSFRPGGNLCSSTQYAELVGNQLVVNQGSLNLPIPLNANDSSAAQWTKGGCIGGMGTHWSYDLSTSPEMSWNASNLMPVVAMYDQANTGFISAFFITTPNVQRSEPFGPWEGPIPSSLMCYNWCSDECSWDVSFWSTLHFYLHDHNLNNCPSHC